MTNLELLKYAYIGALESYSNTKKAVECKDGLYNPDMYNRLAQVQDDYETIRERLFTEIEAVTGQKYE